MLAPRAQNRRRVGGGDSAGCNSTLAGAARRDVARIDGVALWRWGWRSPRVPSARPRASSARPLNSTLADPKPQLGAGFMDPAPTYVGAKSSKPAPTGEVAAQGVEVQPVRHKWRRAPRGGTARARHRAGSAPRGLGAGVAPQRARHRKRARRKSGSTARTWDRKGAALPVNDGVGAQAGAPHHKRAGAGNLPQRRGPSRPGAAGSNRATRRKETPTAK